MIYDTAEFIRGQRTILLISFENSLRQIGSFLNRFLGNDTHWIATFEAPLESGWISEKMLCDLGRQNLTGGLAVT